MSIYEARSDGFYKYKATHDGAEWQQLCTFTATILEDWMFDDGVERWREYQMEATCGRKHRAFRIAESKFGQLDWVGEHLGHGAVVVPGNLNRQHVAFAIHDLSEDVPERQVYAHLGWRKIGKEWVYLHAGGAIGVKGPVPNIDVILPDGLQRFELPDPPDNLRVAIAASVAMLDVAEDVVTVPLWLAAVRAALGSPNFSVWLLGRTGFGKTVLASLAQQHFGAGLTYEQPPTTFGSTANYNEGLSFVAKDALLLVDDYAIDKASGRYGGDELKRSGTRFLRSHGNRAARGRSSPDGTPRAPKPPRSLAIATGEDIPQIESGQARTLIVDVQKPPDWDAVTQAQHNAGDGLYAEAMASFLQWLAPHYSKHAEDARQMVESERAQLEIDGHPRTPETVAELLVALRMWARFVRSTKALDDATTKEVVQRCRHALFQVAGQQARHHEATDPVPRFFSLLTEAIASGRASLLALESPRGDPEYGHVGWLDANGDVYLLPDVAFAIVQQLASDTEQPLAITADTLWKRMADAKMLVSKDKQRNTIRKRVPALRKQIRLLHISGRRVGVAKPAVDSSQVKFDVRAGRRRKPRVR